MLGGAAALPSIALSNPGECALMSPEPDPLVGLPSLGVGLLYNTSLHRFMETDLDCIDFVAIMPDIFRTDRGAGANPRFLPLETIPHVLDRFAAKRPLIAHSVGLSIGTAAFFDTEYVDELARWQARYGFPWHSEHLSFFRLPGANSGERHTALALPVPYDREVLHLISERVSAIRRTVPVPFLLENNVYFVDVPEQEMTEPEFLNALTAASGCGLLLDLHNLYANARNHGFHSDAFLGQLELSRVVEIHVAGGNEMNGVYTDSHCGPCPEEVWAMLRAVAPRAPNLRAVTFEFDDDYYGELGSAGVRAQLDRARSVLSESR
jgi:uncharacterized protein (UPF0276 family)